MQIGTAVIQLALFAEPRFSFSSEALIIPGHGYRVLGKPGRVDCNGVSQTPIPIDRRSAELATCCIIFSKSWRPRELHTMHIKRNARGGLRR